MIKADSKMDSQMEVAEARFSAPTTWSKKKIGEIFDSIFSGGTPKKGVDRYYGGDIPLVKIEDLNRQKGRGVRTAKEFVTEEAVNDNKTKLFPAGTLLLTIYGSIGETAVVQEPVATNQAILGLQDASDDNVLFVKYALDHEKSRLSSLSRQTTQANIGKGILKQYEIELPPLDEQRTIASVLLTVDRAIQTTEAIIAQAKRVKRGLMQDFFHHGLYEADSRQSTKYGSAPAHWMVLPIADVATQIQAGGTPDTSQGEFYDGEIPWIRTGELRQLRIRDSEKKITEAGLANSTARLFPKDTVLIAMYGATAGETAMLEIEATTNQACCGIATDEERLIPEFLFQQLLYLKKNLIALGAGSGQQNISKGIISKFQIFLPPLDEQETIASILREYDKEIEACTVQKEQLERCKKGLMQDLLTGRVRTTGTNIDVLDEVQAHG